MDARTSLTSPTPPLRPTVFFFCRLGDMVMLTSLLSVLHRRYRLPCQVIGTGSWTPAVYFGNPDVHAVWSFHRHVPFVFEGAWRAVRRALRESDPGPIYVCERHYRQLPRIRRMLALSGINSQRCLCLTDEALQGPEHLIDRLVRFGSRTPSALHESAYPPCTDPTAGSPRLYVLEHERAECSAWVEAQGWSNRKIVLIQPGNHRSMGPRRERWRRLKSDDKWWPLERWATLLRKIHQRMRDAVIVLRGSAEEIPMLREIESAAGLASVAVAGQGLRQLFALMEAAHSMISVDTGPAHAAAALNLPLVVLYGAESPLHWLPRSPGGSAVLAVGGAPGSTRADEISAETAFDAWCSLVERLTPLRRRVGHR